MHVDDMSLSDPGPALHMKSIKSFPNRLGERNLKVSPGKTHVGAMSVDFLGARRFLLWPTVGWKNAGALVKMLVRGDVLQVRLLTRGLSYQRTFLLHAS